MERKIKNITITARVLNPPEILGAGISREGTAVGRYLYSNWERKKNRKSYTARTTNVPGKI